MLIKDNSFPFDYSSSIFRLSFKKIKNYETGKQRVALSIHTWDKKGLGEWLL